MSLFLIHFMLALTQMILFMSESTQIIEIKHWITVANHKFIIFHDSCISRH